MAQQIPHYWEDLANQLSEGATVERAALNIGIPLERANAALADPKFRKILLDKYDSHSDELPSETRKYFEKHALKACQTIVDILNDPLASHATKLKAASLILKGMGAEFFKPNPLVSINNKTDNRSMTIEQIIKSEEEEQSHYIHIPRKRECLSDSFDMSIISPTPLKEVKHGREVDPESCGEDEEERD